MLFLGSYTHKLYRILCPNEPKFAFWIRFSGYGVSYLANYR